MQPSEGEEFDLTKFPVCAKKQGKLYVYYHVLPHPREFGEVILRPTGESTQVNPRNKYEADSQALRTLRLVLAHQDKAIENFKENLKQLAEQAYEEAQKPAEVAVTSVMAEAAEALKQPGPEVIQEQ